MLDRGQPISATRDSAAKASRALAECGLDIAISNPTDDVAVVGIRGEVDAACADRLRDALEAAATSGRRVVIDFGDASFIDLAGLSTVLLARGEASAARLAVANVDERTLALFRVLKTASLFESYPTVSAALDAE